MNIVNITSTNIEFANLGFTLLANESKNLRDIDDFYTLSAHLDELVQPMLDGLVQFEEDGNFYTSIASVSSYLNTGITKVDITQNPDSEPLLVQVESNIQDSYSSDDYYYFERSFKLVPGQKYSFNFKGNLREAVIDLQNGQISININEMGDVTLTDYTHFEFNIDYKLKDPVLEITCTRVSEFNLFIEGIFLDDIKSKLQYLAELNNTETEVDVPVIKDTNELIFNTDFMNLDYLNDDIFLESTRNLIGHIFNKGTYSTDLLFKDGMYVDFGEVLNIDTEKDYTISTWFKVQNKNSKKQYLIKNYGEYELFLQNNNLYFKAGSSKTIKLIDEIQENKIYSTIMIYTSKQWKLFVDTEYINTVEMKKKFKNSSLTISDPKYPLIDVKVYNTKIYNYAFSQSMIYYLVNNQNPEVQEDVALNYEQGVRCNFYKCLSNTPNNNYSFTILEKKYAKINYFLDSQDFDIIDSSISILPQEDKFLTIIEGYIYLPETGEYTFGIDGDDAVEFSIEEEVIVAWYSDHAKSGDFSHTGTKVFSSGYKKFKFRHFENGGAANFGLGWQLPSTTSIVQVPVTNFFRRTIGLQPGLFGMKNAIPYGCDFDTAFDSIKATKVLASDTGLSYDYFDIKNLSTLRFTIPNTFSHQSVFTFSYWINTSSGYNYIFAIGNKNYSDYLSQYSSRESIRTRWENTSISGELELNKFCNITITGNGSVITTYLNGVEVQTRKQEQNAYYEYSPMYVNFGTVSSGTPLGYMRSTNFKIQEWFYDDKCYTKHELLNLYNKTKGQYL